MLQTVASKIRHRERISREEAKALYLTADDAQLAQLASEVRKRWHEPDVASYIMMAIVNYTNICVAKCDYCAFYKLPHQAGGYLLSFEEVCDKIDALKAFGGKLVGFNGGFHPKLKITHYAELFRQIHQRYRDSLEFYEMTVAEFMFSCKVSKVSYAEGAELLKAAGTKWVTGGGAEILDDAFRKRHSPGKYSVADYYQAQRAIVASGMNSTATMVIGFDESIDERLNHLENLRNFQDSVDGALPSFLCWTYKPYNTELGGQEVSTREYLRWLAISRIFLDNIINIRTSVLTRNQDALLGLAYGANDFDLPTEDEVTQKAGASISHEFAAILTSARELGFRTIERKPFVRPVLSSIVDTATGGPVKFI
jgi:cyclic dehypoxanthinyl futalosine synthase